jgi:thiamine-phosphate pyrophosphorylase
VTDRAAARGPLPDAVEQAVAAGVDWVQVRERELEGAALLAHVEELAAAARRGAARRGGSVRVLVNRRVDVALAADLGGVHLGFDAMAPESARSLLGEAAVIGLSTHAPEEVVGLGIPLDYAHLAPIFDPLSKPATRPALGLGALERASTSAGRLPVIAQGGIRAANAAACIAAGAAGIAVTGEILAAPNPTTATQSLATELRGRCY